jgi:YHS domain-containing protein
LIRRLILLGVLIWLAWVALRRMLAGPPARRGSPASAAGEMVRDRVCNTFVPRSRALVARVGTTEHFFCSEACRRRFVDSAGSGRPDPTGA